LLSTYKCSLTFQWTTTMSSWHLLPRRRTVLSKSMPMKSYC